MALINTEVDEIIRSIRADFLESKYLQPEHFATESHVTDLNIGLPKIDSKDVVKIALNPNAHPTKLVELWDFEGNVVGYKEIPVDSNFLNYEKNSLMDPCSRPVAPPGSDPLVGAVKLPFWPGGIEKQPTVPVVDEDWGSDGSKTIGNKNVNDPWDMASMIFEIPGFSGVDYSTTQSDTVSFPTRSSSFDRDELLLEPFDSLLPTAEETRKAPVVIDLSHLTMPSLSGMSGVSDSHYHWAIRVDPREAVSSAEFKQKIPEPARVYPFELDTFQKQAVLRMEEHENVFVAAHTSAGKTVVAEYAIAMAIRHRARVIYTSPIKALSNQKFRDFKETFGDVGIITGDIQLRPDASCLIMTTEILRSMLYNGSDVIRDTEWVIFDEVHYVNDPERGHVWEEAMILLPDNVTLVALSATVPNAMDFAEWIGQIKKKKVFVITTAFRPVPLEHNLCITWAVDKFFPLLKPHSVALDQRVYGLAMSSKPAKSDNRQYQHSMNSVQERQAYLALIKSLQKNDNLPAVVFVFSKKKIEELTDELASKIDLLTKTEKGAVHTFFSKSISKLKNVDRQLPQIQKVSNLLKVGVGMHHSGVLPLLKEIVEILFQRGLVKLLFATETFSMGVNMPARTVVFDNIQKSDGKRRRELLPSEYIQMAGRAGRRGIDTIGTVIILCRNAVPEISVLDRMMLGKPVHLESKFRLTTSLVLSMMRVEDLKIEDVLRRTFAEYGWFREKNKFEQEYERLVVERRAMPRLDCQLCQSDIGEYYNALANFWELWSAFLHRLLSERGANKVFMPGRLLFGYFSNEQKDESNSTSVCPFELRLMVFLACSVFGGQLIIRTLSLVPPSKGPVVSSPISARSPNIMASPSDFNTSPPQAIAADLEAGRLKFESVEMKPMDVASIFINKQIRLTGSSNQQLTVRALNDAEDELLKIIKAFKSPDWSSLASSIVDPLKSSSIMQFTNMQLAADSAHLTNLRKQLTEYYTCRACPDFATHLQLVRNDKTVSNRLLQIQKHLSPSSLALGPEYEAIVDILDELKFIDKERGVLLLKGHVACVIGQQNDVLITELLFGGVFSAELSGPELAGVLSPFVCEARQPEEENAGPRASPKLDSGIKAVKEYGLNLGNKMHARRLISSPDSIITDDLRFPLVDAVYYWASGKSFAEVKALTPVDEGLIVRNIQRVDELIRDLREAARIIGDVSLDAKLQEAQNGIKRDIVFAASLYLQ